jgi:hypothetical protein
MTGVSLSTIKRKRTAGAFPNATQDAAGTWLIPVGDLLAAGLHLNRPTQAATPGQSGSTQGHDRAQADPITERIAQLERELAQERIARRHAEQIAAERAKVIEVQDQALALAMRQLMPGPPSPGPLTSTPGPVSEPLTSTEPTAPAADIAPARRGWWARTFLPD